jgi:hypothetical protein
MNFIRMTPARPARSHGRFAGIGWLLLSLFLLLPLKADAGGGVPVVFSFTNATLITNTDIYSYATPYPSTIQVPPLPGVLQSVSITLYGLTDPDTSGIEMLLAGPEGTNGITVDLMCDAGSGPASGITLTLTDTGDPFPTSTPLVSGTYLPSGDTNSENSFPFYFSGFSPFAMAGEGTSQLSDFAGTAVNVTNTWSLYEYYDSFGNGPGGISGGWSVQLTMLPTAPSVITQPATGITNTNATLNGTVNPSLSATTVYFQYGLTTNYGSFSATNILASDLVDAQVVALAVTGLAPGTTIHFQAVAQNSVGTNLGGDLTFSTTAPPVTAPGIAASLTNGTNLILTLSGNPGSNYNVLSTTNLSPPITWSLFTNLTLTSAVQVINLGPLTNRMRFFQVQTSVAPPPAPVLAVSVTNGPSLVLTLSGNSGSSYAILRATNLSPPVTWTTFTNLTLTNAVQTINAGPLTNVMGVFRALQQ